MASIVPNREITQSEEIAENAKVVFADPDHFAGAQLTIGGDEMEIGGMLLDQFDLDPELYLRSRSIEFTSPVRVEVLLDEDDKIYYRLTFLEEA